LSKYHRRAGALNLAVGAGLVLLSLAGLLTLLSQNASVTNSSILFVLVFLFVGGYETVKYAESRNNKEDNKSSKLSVKP
jgi:hypothetical protein